VAVCRERSVQWVWRTSENGTWHGAFSPEVLPDELVRAQALLGPTALTADSTVRFLRSEAAVHTAGTLQRRLGAEVEPIPVRIDCETDVLQ
jgi:hypothetical protein